MRYRRDNRLRFSMSCFSHFVGLALAQLALASAEPTVFSVPLAKILGDNNARMQLEKSVSTNYATWQMAFDAAPRIVMSDVDVELDCPQNWINSPWIDDATVWLRVSKKPPYVGKLIFPKLADGKFLVQEITIPETILESRTQSDFVRIRTNRLQKLAGRFPNYADFFIALAKRSDSNSKDVSYDPGSSRNSTRAWANSSLDMMAGTRAMAENIAFDRVLGTLHTGPRTIPLDAVNGIKVEPLPWDKIGNAKPKTIDSLARFVPDDQYVLFAPNVSSLAELFATIPVDTLLMMGMGSKKNNVLGAYEQQLGTTLAELTRQQDQLGLSSLALTGGDPLFDLGTDICLLLQTTKPQELVSWLRKNAQQPLKTERPETTAIPSPAGAIELTSTPDRQRHAALWSIGNTVIVSNSALGLTRLLTRQAAGHTIDTTPEYQFFRNRYEPTNREKALLIYSDEAIRRWCGPAWRIAQSRRLEAFAWIKRANIYHALNVGNSQQTNNIQTTPDHIGPLVRESRGQRQYFRSELYGTTDFLTPIAEITIDKLTTSEVSAYEAWRLNYERAWRFFDPICIQLQQEHQEWVIDLTVMPLRLNSSYNWSRIIAGDQKLPSSLLRVYKEAAFAKAIAFDPKRPEFDREMSFFNEERIGPTKLSDWMGQYAVLFVLPSPLWRKATDSGDRVNFWIENRSNLPIGLDIQVANDEKCDQYLVQLGRFVTTQFGALIRWERPDLKHPHTHRFSLNLAGLAVSTKDPMLTLMATHRPGILSLTFADQVAEATPQRVLESLSPPPEKVGSSLSAQIQFHHVPELLSTLDLDNQLSAAAVTRVAAELAVLNSWYIEFHSADSVKAIAEQLGWELSDLDGSPYAWDEHLSSFTSKTAGSAGAWKKIPIEANLSAFVKQLERGHFDVDFEPYGLRARATWSLKSASGR